MEWIRIKDSKPLNDQKVLAAISDPQSKLKKHSLLIAYHINETWYDCYDYDIRQVYGKITHWMPLPDKPKEPE